MGNEHHTGGCPCVLPEGAGRDDGAEPKRHGKRANGADGKCLGQGNRFEENKEQRGENEQAQRGGDVNAADIQNAAQLKARDNHACEQHRDGCHAAACRGDHGGDRVGHGDAGKTEEHTQKR